MLAHAIKTVTNGRQRETKRGIDKLPYQVPRDEASVDSHFGMSGHFWVFSPQFVLPQTANTTSSHKFLYSLSSLRNLVQPDFDDFAAQMSSLLSITHRLSSIRCGGRWTVEIVRDSWEWMIV